MRLIIRLALFLVVVAAVADAPLFGQRQGGQNPAGRQGGPDDGGRGRAGGGAGGQGGGGGGGGAQDGRGRGRGLELRTGTSSIRGRVVSATSGSPVRRAQVQATFYAEQGGRGEPPRTTTTDDSGAFLFANIPAGRWTLRAAKSGYVDQQFGQRSAFASVDPVSVAEGQQLNADFRLSRGGAFSGRVVDEFGDPIAGASVTALRFQVTAQGVRTTRTGTTVPSDDTGAYRVYGLPPGQYYISMSDPSARNILVANITAELVNVQGALANAQAVDAASFAVSARDAINGPGANSTSYAPTYYPGTASLADAQRLSLGLGEEQSGINMTIVPVRAARITGKVVGSNGSALQATITLTNQMGQTFSGGGGRGAAGDGAFSITNVPPGSFTLDVVGPRTGSAPPEVASMPLMVNGQDIGGLQITTGAGGRISGSMVSDGIAPLPAATTRITAVPSRGFVPTAVVNGSGTFEFEGLLGVYTLRFESLPNGYMIKSIMANGVDVSDAAIEFRPGDRVSMRVEVTDRITQVSGTVRSNASLNGATVIIFPDEPSKWTSTSRFIKTARPSEGGQFTVSGLPPHSRYLAVAVDFIEPGEAQNPDFLQRAKKAASASFGLSAGDQRILDLPVVTR
jgi:hypothetical protein